MISFQLDEDQRLLQETTRAFARDRVRPRLRELEKAGEISSDLQREFTELGLAFIDMPESLGGAGQSQVSAAVVHEELAWGDAGAAVALFSTQPLAAALLELADDAQQRRFLSALGKPGAVGAVAFSETGVADGPLFLTRARRDGESYLVNGKKSLVLFGGQATQTLIFASLQGGNEDEREDATRADGWDGVGVFLAEGELGATRQRTLGLQTASIAELRFEDLRVPAANRLLGRGNLTAALQRFWARYALITAARQVGLARAAYEHALQYAEDRVAFGKPIAHFEAVAFFLAEMHMDVESARWLVWRAAHALDCGTPSTEDAIAYCAKAAVHASEAAWRAADQAVQILGGAGYMKDHPVEKWMRDTKMLALFAAPSEGHAETIAARELGLPGIVPAHPRLQAPIL